MNLPQILIELRFSCGVHGVNCVIKTERPDIAPLMFAALQRLMS